MKRYLFLLAYEAGEWAAATPESQQVWIRAHEEFEAYVDQHGHRISSSALADDDLATTVRETEGSVSVSDGPFVESVEMIGGYYDIEVPDLDHALAAARLLAPPYVVEVRPTVTVDV